jgi:hypothetical protein
VLIAPGLARRRRGCLDWTFIICKPKGDFKMSKETKEFTIVIMDYSDASVRIFKRNLPKDIQNDELEEILTAEGIYKQSECYFMFAENINIINEV